MNQCNEMFQIRYRQIAAHNNPEELRKWNVEEARHRETCVVCNPKLLWDDFFKKVGEVSVK